MKKLLRAILLQQGTFLPIFIGLCVVIWVAGAAILYANYNIDENMYVSAATLMLRGHAMYGDFDFIQMPLVPLLYAAAFAFLRPEDPYLTAKTFTLFFYLCSCATLFWIGWKKTLSLPMAAMVMLLFAANPVAHYAFTTASNYALPICAITLAFLFFVRGLESDNRHCFMMSGVLVSLAAAAKLYYAPLALPFLWASFVPAAGASRAFYGRGLPMLVGMLFGSLPILFYALKYFDSFWFNNIEYHLISPQFHYQACSKSWFGFCDQKITDLLAVWTNPYNMFTLLAISIVLIPWAGRLRRTRDGYQADAVLVLLAAALLLTAIIASAIPSPPHQEYFAFPVSLMFVLLAVSLPRLEVPPGKVMLLVLVLSWAVIGCGIWQMVRLAQHYWLEAGGVRRIEMVQQELRYLQQHYRGRGKTASMIPLVPIQAGLPYYPELSIGHFVILLGDWYSEDQKRGRVTKTEQLRALLEADPPDYVIVGFGALDRVLKDYVAEHGYLSRDGTVFASPSLVAGKGIPGSPLPPIVPPGSFP